MELDLLDGFEGFVLFEFGKLLFEDVDGVLDLFFPLFELFAFEEKEFAEFDGGEDERVMFVFEEEHEGFLVVLPDFVESECAVVDLFGEVLSIE
jgi:hypothetical protein